jgi:hypothetical protein
VFLNVPVAYHTLFLERHSVVEGALSDFSVLILDLILLSRFRVRVLYEDFQYPTSNLINKDFLYLGVIKFVYQLMLLH